ncbi:MAG: acetyl-CoA C-acyltransferase [Xanthomonadales bacterium]|nr:acetyl-CoA C-acyltransferase [Xanthomonadales bacterium]
MTRSTDVIIAAARRTPIGSFQGQFSNVSATDLGAAAIRAALADSGVAGAEVSEVLMGCVLPAGLGQAPARQASLAAGIPNSVGCTTVNKVCGSGAKTIMLGRDAIAAGSADVVVAGGMECMTNAPYLQLKARGGYRMGHGEIVDHMFWDGLQSPFDQQMMGVFGEACAAHFNFSREEQDAFSIRSVERAMESLEQGRFAEEITPVTVTGRKGDTVVETDQEPPTCNVERIPELRPAFARDGTVTAASSSKISDGAAAVVLMSAAEAERRGTQGLARIVGHATHAQEPEWFTTAPAGSIRKLLDRLGWGVGDVDLWEINEAFAAVAMAAIRELELDADKVNVNGGACALGHPIGATGARLVVTLVHAMRQRGLRRGIASQCIGGGEATAIAVEIPG